MYEHNALGYRSSLALCLTKVRSMFDKGQKQSSMLSCDSSYLYEKYRDL